MNDTERTVLKAAAEYVRSQSRGDASAPPMPMAVQAFYGQMQNQGLSLQEVSVALLLLRDQNLVVTDEPTVGDPRDGEFTFHVTPEGMQAAESGQ